MAQTVLSLVTNRPLPYEGPRLERLTAIFDLVILTLTIVLVVSVARIPRRYRQWKQHGFDSRGAFMRRTSLTALLHFAWPLVLLYVALTAAYWVLIVMFQPDLVYWLVTVAVVVFVKGVLQIALMARVRDRSPNAVSSLATSHSE
jgi:hypothetical protein